MEAGMVKGGANDEHSDSSMERQRTWGGGKQVVQELVNHYKDLAFCSD